MNIQTAIQLLEQLTNKKVILKENSAIYYKIDQLKYFLQKHLPEMEFNTFTSSENVYTIQVTNNDQFAIITISKSISVCLAEEASWGLKPIGKPIPVTNGMETYEALKKLFNKA